MSRRCQVTGREPAFGKSVSHSHMRTSRRWDPNIQSRRFWVPFLGRHVRLKVSVKGLRTIDKRGIETVVRELLAQGVKL